LQVNIAIRLRESTVCFAVEYGKTCRRVRYPLLEGTVFLVGQYGKTCR
jgi:hypothetical protein